jgi:hypothetical protein
LLLLKDKSASKFMICGVFAEKARGGIVWCIQKGIRGRPRTEKGKPERRSEEGDFSKNAPFPTLCAIFLDFVWPCCLTQLPEPGEFVEYPEEDPACGLGFSFPNLL